MSIQPCLAGEARRRFFVDVNRLVRRSIHARATGCRETEVAAVKGVVRTAYKLAGMHREIAKCANMIRIRRDAPVMFTIGEVSRPRG